MHLKCKLDTSSGLCGPLSHSYYLSGRLWDCLVQEMLHAVLAVLQYGQWCSRAAPYSDYRHRCQCGIPRRGRGLGIKGGKTVSNPTSSKCAVKTYIEERFIYFIVLEIFNPVRDYGHPRFGTKE